MIIKSFGPMQRQGSDLDKITSLLVNCRVDGKERSRLKTIPGYSVNSVSVAIDGGGTVTRGNIYSHKDRLGNEYIFMISSNNLYYLNSGTWYLVTWKGILTQDFDVVRFWSDRGTMHINGGFGGIPTVYEYLERVNDEGTGYFESAGEDFTGYFYGEEKLREFSAVDNVSSIMSLGSRVMKSVLNTWNTEFGLDRTVAYFVFGQFVYEGGQVSIPSTDAVIAIAPPDIGSDETFYTQIRIAISKNTGSQDGYDKRLVGVDLYAAQLTDDASFGAFDYVEKPGEEVDSPIRTLSDDSFASLPWKWLTRLRVNKENSIYEGAIQLASFATAQWTLRNDLIVDDEATRKIMEDGLLNSNVGQYYLYFRPLGGLESEWQEAAIKGNVGQETASEGVTLIYLTSIAGLGLSAANDGQYYECKIYNKWVSNTDVKYRTTIQIWDYSNLAGKIVTVDSTALTEGVDWSAGADNAAAGTSLASAINALAGITCDSINVNVTSLFVSTVVILSDASVTVTSDANNADMVLSSPLTQGGHDDEVWEINALIRRTPKSEIEVADLAIVAQPYALREEYYPLYEFAVTQNRRVFRYDCTTDKRYKNMLMWSEIDKPQVIPNRNYAYMNTFPGEESRGLVQIHNAVLALSERTAHVVRMTGEPIQYDAEESVIDTGCLSARGVIEIDNTAYWPGFDGFNRFSTQFEEISRFLFEDDYKALIANEYAANSSSYAAIVAGYSAKEKMIVWSFPNSTYTIDGLIINLIGYDLRTGDLIILQSDKVFDYFATDMAGNLIGVDVDNGIYDLFSASPTETNAGRWTSGQIAAGGVNKVRTMILRLRYKGTPTVKVTADGNIKMNEAWPEKTSVDFEHRQINLQGNELEVQIDTSATNTVDIIDRVELNMEARLQ